MERASASFRASCGGNAADFECLVGQPVFSQHDGSAAEGVRLDDVRASFEIFAVDAGNNVGAREYQILVAAFQVRAAEILGGQILLLQHGAHGAIQDEDALAQQFAKG